MILENEEVYSQVEVIQNRHQSSQEWTSQQIHPKIRPCTSPQTLQASVNMLNDNARDSTVRKIWDNYGMFGRLARRKLLLSKKHGSMV